MIPSKVRGESPVRSLLANAFEQRINWSVKREDSKQKLVGLTTNWCAKKKVVM